MSKLAGCLAVHYLQISSFLHTVNAVQEYYLSSTDCTAMDYMTSMLSSDYCDDDDGLVCDDVVRCVTLSGIINAFVYSSLYQYTV